MVKELVFDLLLFTAVVVAVYAVATAVFGNPQGGC